MCDTRFSKFILDSKFLVSHWIALKISNVKPCGVGTKPGPPYGPLMDPLMDPQSGPPRQILNPQPQNIPYPNLWPLSRTF